MRAARNHAFDLLRILFATLVLLSHSFDLTDGDRVRELLSRVTHRQMTFGDLSVDGFFLLSGLLIVQSWEQNPDLVNFLRKRILRIVPGYLVAVLLSTVVVGWAAPAVPHFFRQLGWVFVKNTLVLNYPFAPPVLPGLHVGMVNGALWTIAYEFRCYLMVALLGISGLLRRRWFILAITLVLLYAAGIPVHEPWLWSKARLVLGNLAPAIRLYGVFFTGVCFWLFRDLIRFNASLAAAAVALLLAVDAARTTRLETTFILCGGYLLFYLGSVFKAGSPQSARLTWMRSVPDISYGIYLYGWPVLGLLLWWTRLTPPGLFLCSTLICYPLGWLSWHFVERPMLKLKRKTLAELPPA